MSSTPFSGIWEAPGIGLAIAGGHVYDVGSVISPRSPKWDIVPAPGSCVGAYSASFSLTDTLGQTRTFHLRTSGNDVMSVASNAGQTEELIRVPDTDPFYTPVAQNLVVLGAFTSVQLALAALSNAQPWAVAWPPCNPCPCLDQGCPGPSFPTKAGPLPGQQGAAIAATAADALLKRELSCHMAECPPDQKLCWGTCPHVNSPTAVCDMVRDAKAQVALTLAQAPYGRR